jgi:hypothetical protein
VAKALDLNFLNAGFTSIKIGKLSKEVISLLKLNRSECDIILWEDRFIYIEKHIQDFESEEAFENHISCIPDIIENPDYVGRHPKDNSIQYIKRINELMLVAVRIKDKGNLSFRSAYPITEAQLDDYLMYGNTTEYNKDIDKTD